MPTLQKLVLQKFLSKISGRPEFDEDKVNQLKRLLESGKKVKSDDLVFIFSQPSGADVK